MRTWNIFFDGICEPNPGGVLTWGYAIDRQDGHLITSKGARKPAPDNTNNVAEYFALGVSIRKVSDLLATEPGAKEQFAGLMIRGDSQLVVKQIEGEWAVRAPNIAPLHARCLELLLGLGQPWAIEWVPREQNTLADKLSRDAFRELTGHDPIDRYAKPRRTA